MAKVTAKRKAATPPPVSAAVKKILDNYDPYIGPIPAFLVRPDAEPGKVDIKDVSARREWIMPDPNRVREEPKPQLFIDNPAAPVSVVYYKPKKRGVPDFIKVKGKKVPNPDKPKDEIVVLQQYSNMAEFELVHDHKIYPVKPNLTKCNKNLTMIFVQPKPWTDKITVPGINDDASPATAAQVKREKKVRDFSQPDAPGKPVADGSSLAAILRLMLQGNKTMDEIVRDSGVEGGVLSAEDKVLHRIKFVLFRQHGVGHTVNAAGHVNAVLPSGFDAKTMFKAPKK